MVARAGGLTEAMRVFIKTTFNNRDRFRDDPRNLQQFGAQLDAQSRAQIVTVLDAAALYTKRVFDQQEMEFRRRALLEQARKQTAVPFAPVALPQPVSVQQPPPQPPPVDIAVAAGAQQQLPPGPPQHQLQRQHRPQQQCAAVQQQQPRPQNQQQSNNQSDTAGDLGNASSDIIFF